MKKPHESPSDTAAPIHASDLASLHAIPDAGGALATQTPAPAPVPASDAADDLPAAIDAHGYDPAAYDWVPVARRPRSDGWSDAKQRSFIETLADMGSVADAAREIRMSVTSCYRLRRAPGAENFARAWDAAIAQGADRLVDVAFDRAFNGTEDPVLDKLGQHVGMRRRYSDRLLMFLLRAHHPERYGHVREAGGAHADGGGRAQAAPPAALPMAEALRMLVPVAPPEPHRLMAPDDLETALQVADICDGDLPHWRRDPPDDDGPDHFPLGEAFERRLEAAKRGEFDLSPEDDEDDKPLD